MKDRSDDPSHHERTLLPWSYTSLLAGTRNSSMSPPWRIDPTTHHTMSERSYHGATSRSIPHVGDSSALFHVYIFCLQFVVACIWKRIRTFSPTSVSPLGVPAPVVRSIHPVTAVFPSVTVHRHASLAWLPTLLGPENINREKCFI